MKIHIIKSKDDYNAAMAKIDQLLDSSVGSDDAEKLEILSILVEDYENKHFKIDTPDPVVAIKQRAADLGLSRKDLEKSIGSRARISEIFNKKRNLTLPMIRRLHKNLNIPAEILISDTSKKLA